VAYIFSRIFTVLAIQHFQTLRGLKPDGIVGALTKIQLLK